MAELKTKKNAASVSDFIGKVADEQKREDSEALLKIFSEVTNEKPTMWGGGALLVMDRIITNRSVVARKGIGRLRVFHQESKPFLFI